MTVRDRICSDFKAALEEMCGAGYRLDSIYPADAPHTAILSRAAEAVRLTSRPDAPPPATQLPPFAPEFVLTLAGTGSAQGRAGMLYRDLIPGRLGGRYVASHLTIPNGGPVADWVHFHRVAFQMIFVRSGWVRVVYEDQGDPFVMNSGDLVLQPPEIRHRVLESSAGLDVIEIGCPALHETCADHTTDLPNGRIDEPRSFDGQRFLRHVAAEAPWIPFHEAEARETGMFEATGGLAAARVLRRGASTSVALPPHDGELVFGFVLEGHVRLRYRGDHPLGPADAFVVPPGEPWSLTGLREDLRLLYVTTAKMPGGGRSIASIAP